MFTVLVIDDTKSVHAFIRSLVGKTPEIQLKGAMNGAEALELLQKGEAYDLILLDWEMPILNGPDTLTKIKEMGVSTPVVMMTTKNSAKDIQTMLEAGVAEYMMKPFTSDILFEKIAFVTGREFTNAA